MKNLFPVLPLAALLVASCQQNTTPVVQTLPPVIGKKVTSPKPNKQTAKKVTKVSDTASDAAADLANKSELNPLDTNPLNAIPEVEAIPRFQVPENVQPKVTDGIDQGLFIELKW